MLHGHKSHVLMCIILGSYKGQFPFQELRGSMKYSNTSLRKIIKLFLMNANWKARVTSPKKNKVITQILLKDYICSLVSDYPKLSIPMMPWELWLSRMYLVGQTNFQYHISSNNHSFSLIISLHDLSFIPSKLTYILQLRIKSLLHC